MRKIPWCLSQSCYKGMHRLGSPWKIQFCLRHMCLQIPAVCLWEG